MTQFELWVKGCEINKTDLWCLEGSGETGLYKTQSWHLVKNNYYGDTPVYHVWVDGKCKCSITNYQSALAVWRREVKK